MSLIRRCPALLLSLLLAGCASPLPLRTDASASDSPPLQGAWRQEGGSRLLSFEKDRVVEFDGRLVVRGIVREQSGQLVLRKSGVLEEWQVAVQGDRLQVNTGGGSMTYRKLSNIPPEVDLTPVTLGKPIPLPAERVREIQAAIADRFKKEQDLYKSKNQKPGEVAAMTKDNLGYLTRLVQDIGWIDVKRFGNQTSVYATILAKHTQDLRLMIAILPRAKDDLKMSGEGQTYAVLYDGLQIELGGKQRYGTQIAEDEQGQPYVLPVEDPEKIDVYLSEMGLPPYSKYLSDLKEFFYPDESIQIRWAPEDCQKNPKLPRVALAKVSPR